ncbi:MAG: stage II sporulation protein R [Bacillota bacterium]|nr:stage II sporulation protein R [Bacillota bacterium]
MTHRLRWLVALTGLILVVVGIAQQRAVGVTASVALPAAGDAVIPPEAIRFRVIANSDAPEDQAVKRAVRDVVVAHLEEVMRGAQRVDEARARLAKALPTIEALAVETVRAAGFTYPVEVTLGRVPFPTKRYGTRVYPAGEYEALRITLGNGRGQNWWCVLFPPLCFVDVAASDAVDPPAQATAREAGGEERTVETRLFLFDALRRLLAWLWG